MFALSSTLQGHSSDVRCVHAYKDLVLSGSRDSTVKAWYPIPVTNYTSSGFINALQVVERGPETLVVSAGNDNLVSLYPLGVPTKEPEYCLVGHTANICSLDVKDSQILSGSWDGTAILWKDGKQVLTLKAHEGTVWAARFFGDGFVTCGADKTVKVYNSQGKVSASFDAHTDVVRDIIVTSKGNLVTCSNDTTVKIWQKDTWKLLHTLKGHISFVYSVVGLPDGRLASCGEDRSVRIWDGDSGECLQTIYLPCVSVWCLDVTESGDLVVGTSDAQVRVFTTDPAKVASQEELEEFTKAVESSSVPEGLYQVDKSKLSGLEALDTPGKEGVTKMVMNNGVVEIYQSTGSKWQKVGDLVSSASDKKTEYNGIQYDFVFDVDIEDGKPPLKLPYNSKDNVYEAAETFLAKNNLPYTYLQEVVNFILQNAQGATIETKKGVLPQREYLTFDKFEPSKTAAGFRKLNESQPEEWQFDSRRFETLLNCDDSEALAQMAAKIIFKWTDGAKLVGYDILRTVITKIAPFDNLFEIIKVGLQSENPKVCMMALRTLNNVFGAPWGQQTFLDPEVLDVALTSQIKKDAQKSKAMNVTVATFLLNYAVLAAKTGNPVIIEAVASKIEELVRVLAKDEEAAYRSLVAVGTLNFAKRLLDGEEIARVLTDGRVGRFQSVLSEM